MVSIRFFEDSTLNSETGFWQSFYLNGIKESETQYSSGQPVGIWRYYNKKGNLLKEVDYSFTLVHSSKDCNKITNQGLPEGIRSPMSDSGFDEMPGFGDEGIQFIPRLMNFDLHFVDKFKGSGQLYVFVHFSITASGKAESVKVCNYGFPILEKEAARIILESPKWKPASKKGIEVESNYVMPIVFIFP